MKPVFQTRNGDPEGNCFAACVASILECSIEELPDLHDLPEGENWLEWFNTQLAPRGFAVAEAEAPLHAYIPAGTHFIAAGAGRRGMRHCVVMKSSGRDANQYADTFVHDPYRGGDGLVSVSSVSFVVK